MEINTKTANLQRHLAMVECLVPGAVCVSCARTVLGGACYRNHFNEGRRQHVYSTKVRAIVRKWQKDIVKDQDYIVEGRDIGSVVFPEANIKLFITATLEERTNRRHKQLSKYNNVDMNEIMKNLENRDNQDIKRESSPLLNPEGAFVIDTTGKTIEEVMKVVVDIVKERCPTHASTL